MAVLVQSDIRDEVRARVGDDDSANYLMSDATMNRAIAEAYTELFRYASAQAENAIAGTGALEYALTAGIIPNLVTNVYVRTGTDITTDLWVSSYKIYNGKIRMPFIVSSGTNIIVQSSAPLTIASDVDTTVATMLYLLLEIAWLDFASKKRADFEQWAATTRSDARIGDILQLRRQLSSKLEELAKEYSVQLNVIDVWGGV